ncbi:3-hydroxybutyryl-CoA dehydrogenase [Bartonella sp. HY406]|uniref:3-hydroxybutyryl-CoA dehydrogenase n=1 Tax=Bartonella sp. HY406 TaxID=2979331 RepID=UPI0021C9DC64|nr:3-hydroxybutyryl-CoA dehydrogenase [Bartonella sp. HY406]UXN03929.1 3-hydroxybutyryl-CoA dehydrogenase [Bartonella sp. HY406]
MAIKTIGIIGAGQMGSGIAQTFAAADYSVLLNDLSEESLKAGIAKIAANYDRQISRAKASQSDKDKALANITTSLSLGDIGRCDLIIEAATEQEVIKKQIFDKLKPHVSDKTIIASNTSSISITRLAGYNQNPAQFLGIHFMNPAPVMQLVEVIRGIATDDDSFNAVLDVVNKIGKVAIKSADYPAFIVNRILIPMINEAIYVLYESVGNVTDIDNAMKLGANQPMGPLELADFIGLDTCLAIMNVLSQGFVDSKYRPCPLLVKYVEAGWLGRKSGIGFYDYRNGEPIASR